MNNLIPLGTATIDEFDLIHNSKYNPTKALLTGLKTSIIDRYNQYDIEFAANTIENIPAFNYIQTDKTALLKCYTSETNAKDSLISRIKNNQPLPLRSVCQVCGLNSDDTSDHFLPKEQYPEFCVNHKNLIPCCFRCNLLKGEYLIDNRTNTRGILNLYTDVLPNVQFLFVDIIYLDAVPTPTFSINNPNGINGVQYQIIQYHFEKLHLLDRYNDKFGSLYKQILSAYSDPFYNNKPELVSRLLLQDAQTLFEDFGRNYYIAIIKASLSKNINFLNLFN